MAYVSAKEFTSIMIFLEERDIKPCSDLELIETMFTDYKYWLDARGGISSIDKNNVEALKQIRALVMKVWVRSDIDDTKKRENSYKKKYLFWFLRTKIKVNLSLKFISDIGGCDESNVIFHLKDVEALNEKDKVFKEITKGVREDLDKTFKKYLK